VPPLLPLSLKPPPLPLVVRLLNFESFLLGWRWL
jgi:hypothetical protein